jgi:hypothetical protein
VEISGWGLGLEPFGECCVDWSQELVRLSGVAGFALLLECPHKPEGAAELSAEEVRSARVMNHRGMETTRVPGASW